VTDKPTNVRLATVADEGVIFYLLMDLEKRSSVAKLLPYRPERVCEKIRQGTRQHGVIIGVIDGERPREIVASVGLSVEEHGGATPS
jgi:hypothetical protein